MLQSWPRGLIKSIANQNRNYIFTLNILTLKVAFYLFYFVSTLLHSRVVISSLPRLCPPPRFNTLRPTLTGKSPSISLRLPPIPPSSQLVAFVRLSIMKKNHIDLLLMGKLLIRVQCTLPLSYCDQFLLVFELCNDFRQLILLAMDNAQSMSISEPLFGVHLLNFLLLKFFFFSF